MVKLNMAQQKEFQKTRFWKRFGIVSYVRTWDGMYYRVFELGNVRLEIERYYRGVALTGFC